MKRIKRYFSLIVLFLFFIFGFYVSYRFFGKNGFTPHYVNKIDNQKLSLETAIINKFQSKKELITFEVELTDVVEWDDSWGTLSVFHKSQRIRFYGNGLYITDLNLITKDDIKVDTDKKTVSITLPEPIVKSITINEEKTEYESLEKGWLRFGDISLTPEQYNTLYHKVKENMKSNLDGSESKEKAKNNTQSCVKEIFQIIMDSFEKGYSLQIDWRANYQYRQ